VTSAPLVARSLTSIDVVREDYVCAAAPAIARRVRGLADLRGHTWIEHDRSFPFLRYLSPADRAALACRDAWFVGSSTAMVSALVAGHGVGIVPRYLAAPALRSGKLRRVLRSLTLAHDLFRVVHRADRGADLRAAAALLRDALLRRGLR
jgi:DNA-binding transcriptional LysR family regulator